MGSIDLAAPRCVPLWAEELSLTCPDAHNPPGLDKILWQGNEQVHWLEMKETTNANIFREIDRVLQPRNGDHVLIGARREVTPLLHSGTPEPWRLAEIVPIQSDRDVWFWLSVNTLAERMNLLFYGHRGSASESGTDSPVNIHFTCCHNRGPSRDVSQSSNDDSSEGINPESSAKAEEKPPLSKTTMTKNRTRNPGTVRHSVMVGSEEPGSDSDVFYDAAANPASTEIQALCSNTPPPRGKQSYPTANQNSHILRSGQQKARGNNMKKVSKLHTSAKQTTGVLLRPARPMYQTLQAHTTYTPVLGADIRALFVRTEKLTSESTGPKSVHQDTPDVARLS